MKGNSSEQVWHHSGPIPSALLLHSKSGVSCHSAMMKSENSHRNTSPAVQKQQRWIRSAFNSISLRGENTFCHRAAVNGAEPLPSAGNDSLLSGRAPSWAGRGPQGPFGFRTGGWVGGWWGGRVTLTCSRLRASCRSCMLDDKRSHLHSHVKSHLCGACNDWVATSDSCWFYSTLMGFVVSAMLCVPSCIWGQWMLRNFSIKGGVAPAKLS